MSEKMFGTRVDDVDSTIINITRNDEDFAWFLSDDITDKQVEKVVDLLNEFDEENEQLKKAKKINAEYAEQIVEENHKFRIEKNDLRIENKRLRKTINEVIELLAEEVDLFSDKATEHDIIAYKEMNEFDNKDAYYMCISTKKAIKMLQRCLDE